MPSFKEVIKTNIFSIDPDIFCGFGSDQCIIYSLENAIKVPFGLDFPNTYFFHNFLPCFSEELMN